MQEQLQVLPGMDGTPAMQEQLQVLPGMDGTPAMQEQLQVLPGMAGMPETQEQFQAMAKDVRYASNAGAVSGDASSCCLRVAFARRGITANASTRGYGRV